ncbi:NPCBM/NEW2 domain-containing protein [Streptomyces hundungensis]|uniref:NPCBM/NEW2 domain-containing protein n=1 Tax=Streptomyces hundungensis TaxID=1077946 RepID=UPI002483069C|nr:NPCBM/NEW2 domain-containing protein [Streptomyces hundungensis]
MACGRGPSAGTHALSDLAWTSAVNGWGPVERDRSNGEQAAGDGKALTLNGATYTKGLGTHAASVVTYYLGGSCTAFQATVGVDDEVGTKGSVAFQVYRDGALAADSGKVTGADAAKAVSADVSGAQELKLVVTDSGDGVDYDHADWATPQLTCT